MRAAATERQKCESARDAFDFGQGDVFAESVRITNVARAELQRGHPCRDVQAQIRAIGRAQNGGGRSTRGKLGHSQKLVRCDGIQ